VQDSRDLRVAQGGVRHDWRLRVGWQRVGALSGHHHWVALGLARVEVLLVGFSPKVHRLVRGVVYLGICVHLNNYIVI